VTPKGNQIHPTEPARIYVAVDTTTRSYVTIHKHAYAIRPLLNTIFTVIARVTCMRPRNSGEVKPKS
jgi:hypothetical protein